MGKNFSRGGGPAPLTMGLDYCSTFIAAACPCFLDWQLLFLLFPIVFDFSFCQVSPIQILSKIAWYICYTVIWFVELYGCLDFRCSNKKGMKKRNSQVVLSGIAIYRVFHSYPEPWSYSKSFTTRYEISNDERKWRIFCVFTKYFFAKKVCELSSFI